MMDIFSLQVISCFQVIRSYDQSSLFCIFVSYSAEFFILVIVNFSDMMIEMCEHRLPVVSIVCLCWRR